MKGQAINIDWSVGFGLFLFTLLSSIVLISDVDILNRGESSLETKASEVQNSLISDLGREVIRSNLVLKQPSSKQNIPYYRDYFFKSIDDPEGSASEPSYFNFSSMKYATVTDGGNRTVNITYTEADISSSYYSEISSTSSWLNNTEISLELGGPGLESMKVGSEETINEADIDFSTDFRENDVFHKSGNLTLFNSSEEFLVEDESFRIDAKNFSTLYWEEDGTEYDLDSGGTVKEGETDGLVVANSSIGITLIGNITANVSRPDSSTTRIEVEADRTRIRLHQQGVDYGKERISGFVDGEVFLNLERRIEAATNRQIDRISNMSEQEFESNYSLEDYGYNFTLEEENSSGTFKKIDRGEEIPLEETGVERFTENLLRGGDLVKLEGRVVVWQ